LWRGTSEQLRGAYRTVLQRERERDREWQRGGSVSTVLQRVRERESGSAAEVCHPAAGRFVGHAPLTYCHHGTRKLTVAKLAENKVPLPAVCNCVLKTAPHSNPKPD
jgi:hypothetical protein